MARPDQPGLMYLDSCILITYLKQDLHPVISPLVKLILEGKYQAAISSLHYVEVIGKQRAEAFDPVREEQVMNLIESPRFSMIDIGPDVQYKARRYVLHESLKSCDAMHVAAAVVGECDVLLTLDGGLQKRFGSSRVIDGVPIEEAYLPSNETGTIQGL